MHSPINSKKTKSKSKKTRSKKTRSKKTRSKKTRSKKTRSKSKHISKKIINKMSKNNSNKSPFIYAYNSLLDEIDKLQNLDIIVSKFSLDFSPLSGSEPKYEPHKMEYKS